MINRYFWVLCPFVSLPQVFTKGLFKGRWRLGNMPEDRVESTSTNYDVCGHKIVALSFLIGLEVSFDHLYIFCRFSK